MIGLNFVYPLSGLVFAAFALFGMRERRWANAAFQGLVALSLLAGDRLGDLGNGLLVLALVGVAASGRMRRRSTRPDTIERRPAALLPIALIIPATAVAGTLLFKAMPALVDPKQATLVALAAGTLIALGCGIAAFGARLTTPFEAGGALADEIGWAIVLPQMLASLGAIFALAGVGTVVGRLIGGAVPDGSIFGAVLAYGLGMALFTIVMGNAFAAFPVMAVAVGIPLLVYRYGAAPAPVAAIGMLAGFCGTQLTPMAANFNIVPAALLDLKDRYGVIRAQAPTAVLLLVFNLGLLWWVVA